MILLILNLFSHLKKIKLQQKVTKSDVDLFFLPKKQK